MRKRQYFGTDGIRGEVGTGNVTPEFALRLGWAAGRVLAQGEHGKVVIGKDTRISGYMFESALEAGLSAAGVDVLLLGPMPTPAIAYLTRTLRAQAGIVISASHNPFQDNGFKFFSEHGTKLSDDVELAIEEMLNQPMTTVDSAILGKARRIEDAAGRYVEFCKRSVPYETDLSGIKIVLDCTHGAGYHVAPQVFTELGAEVISIGDAPNGLNINLDCGATSLAALQAATVAEGAHVGIALDGDADRLMMVDSAGVIVDGDELMSIIALQQQKAGHGRPAVVGTLMTNLGIEHALAERGLTLHRAQVGDRHVMEVMKQTGSIVGGESSGHIICLDKTTTGDAIIAALQVLVAMQDTASSLRSLCAGLHKYPQTLVNVRVAGKVDLDLPVITEAVAQAESELADTGRVLLRASGTEPLIRVMVEGRDAAQVSRLAQAIADVVATV